MANTNAPHARYAMTDAARKKAVADRIADELMSTAFANNLTLRTPDGDMAEVTVTRPTNLVTQIRVKTQSAGTHYYDVKVSESY